MTKQQPHFSNWVLGLWIIPCLDDHSLEEVLDEEVKRAYTYLLYGSPNSPKPQQGREGEEDDGDAEDVACIEC